MVPSRRALLGLLGAAGGAGLAGCTARDFGSDGLSAATDSPTPPGGPQAWPMFQRDRRHSGDAATTGPTDDASEKWRRPDLLPEDRRVDVSDTPAVVNGTVYFGSHVPAAGQLNAVSAADGAEQWRLEFDDFVPGVSAVVDGTVYVGTVAPSSGRVYALSAADGAEQWRYVTDSYPSSPVVVDGTVYLCSGYSVSALSAADGSNRWTVEMGAVNPRGQRHTAPAVADGTVYVGTGSRPTTSDPDCEGRRCWETPEDSPDQNSVNALSAADGAVEWHAKTGSRVAASPTVADGTVYAVSDKLYAFAATDGAEEWAVEVYTEHSPAVADGTVYVAGGTTVSAFSAADGDEQWRYDLPYDARPRPEFVAPVVADDTIYAVSRTEPARRSSTVHALSASDGTERWHFEVDMRLPPPAVVDGTLHLGPVALS